MDHIDLPKNPNAGDFHIVTIGQYAIPFVCFDGKT